MKTLSKKLLSLLLVAVMLVAAMPFAAFADAAEPQAATKTFPVKVYVGDGNLVGETTTVQSETITSDDVTEDVAAEILEGTVYPTAAYKFEKATVKDGTIYIRYSKVEHVHDYKTLVPNSGTAEGHLMQCACGDTKRVAHGDEAKTVANAKAATCTAEGYTGDTTYACGYTEVGTSVPKLAHDFGTADKGKCANCGATKYIVKLTVDGSLQQKSLVLEEGSSTNLSTASNVLAALGMNADNYNVGGTFVNNDYVIEFSVTTKGASATTVNITLINGNSQSTQNVEVGKYYSDYAAFNPAAQDGRTPESLKIESNNGTTRFVNVNTKTDSGKILATDTKVTIQWKAADRQIRFYTDSTLGKIYKTLTVYSGKAIGELPTEVNGKTVEYWTVWGSRIYTTTTYDWTADYVDAVPHFAGETGKVYLEVYVNGNRTSKYAQVDITHKLQDGVIYRDTLLDTIRSATKNNSLKLSSVSYLFNESEWSQYVRNVNNTTTNTKIQIGTDSQDARYVYVMVNGVTTKTTDPSNPKTGDSAKLGVAAAVLAVAVVGFGAVIVVNKKKGKI
ncbi:MAG: hypothetical protein SPI68_01605 [Candidatus Faecousia sp.]|nr:hypothetical protein [Candidatus Faecousia sp.]